MYIEQVDEILDNDLDMLFKIYKTGNIELNKVLTDEKSILYILDKKGRIFTHIEATFGKRYSDLIINIFEKLVTFYIILIDSFNNKLKVETLTSNLVKSSQKMPSILKPENVAKILDLYKLIILIEDVRKNKIKNPPDEINKFINDNIKFISDKTYALHNIIKIVLIMKIYISDDRLGIATALENDNIENAETKYIEIIDATTDEIDYAAIEALFNPYEVKKGNADVAYKMIENYEIGEGDELNTEKKVNILFEKKLLIPITDEFLRYNKSSEKYEIKEVQQKSKKLDRIRSVVTNINQVADYYSKKIKDYPNVKEEIDKLFYQPLIYRKAIPYNDKEEIVSIMKLVNMGLSAMRSNEHFQDLVSYRNYAYINFNDFKDFGFPLRVNSSIQAIRYCNFEYKDYKKSTNESLECRMISSDTRANIVGIALPKRSPLIKPTLFQCITNKNIMNLKKLFDNPYSVIVKKLEKMLLQNEQYGKLGYWIFDKKYDKLKIHTYDEINEMSFEVFYKYMISTIYDQLVTITYNKIIKEIITHNKLNIDQAFTIGYFYQNSLISLSSNPELEMKLINELIEFSKIKEVIEHDEVEDFIPGLDSKLIKLPSYKKDKKDITKIRVTHTDTRDIGELNLLYENSICQHFISWNKLKSYRKRDPNKFNQLLFEFKKKYVILNTDGDFICKSCYQPVDIKKYAYDWTTETEEGIALSFSLESQLETLPDYEKYNRSIKNMDKLIEKIAFNANIPLYLGNIPQIKVRRQEIIKGVIDLILIQNQTLRSENINERKERVETASKLYGISKDYTQFFLFEFKNDIFTFSSKDTDKFKRYKLNNIMIYIIMLLVNQLTLGQILYLIEDKLINIETFDNHFNALFDKLKIRINNSDDMVNIKEYPLLCFVIYLLSGILIKYKLWYTDIANINKFDIPTYRSVIHTYIDLINSILEVNTKPDRNYQYEVFATKFFTQLRKIYSSNDTLDRIRKKALKIDITDKKDKYINKAIDIPLTGILERHYFGYEYSKVKSPKVKILTAFYFSKLPYLNKNDKDEIYKEMFHQTLIKLFYLYKLDGSKRTADDIITEKDIQKVKHDDLIKMYEKIRADRIKISLRSQSKKEKYINELNIKLKEYENKAITLIDTRKKVYIKITEFIKLLEDNIGAVIENSDGTILNLDKNIYTIENDYNGKKLSSPYTALEGSKNIIFKQNDPHYKTNVYIYQNDGITMIFHATHLYLLGYKSANSKLTDADHKNTYLKINYSIKNKLLYLGHEYIHYPLNDETVKNTLSTIIRNRINNLKNILVNFQRILHQIRNKFTGPTQDNLVKLFMPKFKSIIISDDNKKILNDLNTYAKAIYFKPFDKNVVVQEDQGYIYVGNLNLLENGDTMILDYLCNELTQLLIFNKDNKSTFTNLIYLIVNFIDSEFNRCAARGISSVSYDIKKFKSIQTESFTYDITEDDFLNVIETEAMDNEEAEGGFDVDIDEEDLKEDFGEQKLFHTEY